MSDTTHPGAIGVIGLGIMGGSYARLMCNAGLQVFGYDPDSSACDRLRAAGGTVCASPAEVATRAQVILLALASPQVLDLVVTGPEGITRTLAQGAVVCEMGTFPIDTKQRIATAIAQAGGTALDCPVSGTGAQAAVGDLVVYASGDTGALDLARPALQAIGRELRYVGEFGAGMKMKIVANLLVTIHNLAAAEALLLAKQSGLDLQLTYDAITSGAGTSRMLEVRGPMMIAENYQPATMRQSVYAKDLRVIMDHAGAVGAPTPLMQAALPIYAAALDQGLGDDDTASVFAVLKDMAGSQS